MAINTVVDTFSIDKKTHAKLIERAKKEKRNKSQMASLMIAEGLQATTPDKNT